MSSRAYSIPARLRNIAGWLFLAAWHTMGAEQPTPLSEDVRRQLERDVQSLGDSLDRLGFSTADDHLADARLFHKGLVWALRYETAFSSNELALMQKSLARGRQRATALDAKKTPWATRHGKVLRGFISRIDGSIQPYGVIIPRGYDGTKAMRLDVVLHGSSKPHGLSELRFGERFDDGDTDGKPAAAEGDFIELHPLGRVENCYRWAGETDVFEAIEAVSRNYRIDRDRMVLRGMSMGASGTWHIGLKYPDRFVALGPYCGYVDTHQFSETPIPSFIRVGTLPPHQERALHMLDSIDYAPNAGVVPAIAAIGEQDVFFQAHVIMGEAMAKEGLSMVNLISPGTGHVIDPVTHREQMRRIDDYAAAGLNRAPRQVRFVTWTLKYNRCHWLELLALNEHYARAEIIANVADDGSVEVQLTRNIRQFAIHPPMLTSPMARLRIAGKEVDLPRRRTDGTRRALIFSKNKGRWNFAGYRDSITLKGKRPGLQGPLDDAFATPFLCVRGTGRPWNPAVGAWADASLRRFNYEWARYMRGGLPLKDDIEVTQDDVRTKNLILFGDPGSNLWIRKALPRLPIIWTKKILRMGQELRSAEDHAPALICSSPFAGADDHYLVINSGHTFHEKEFASLNYLLFPRLGDWAQLKVFPGAESWQPSSPSFPEEVVRAGFFNEEWKPMP